MHMTTDIAIVGAGIAGTYCAHLLNLQERQVTVIEKSRGTGGRASSKRLEDGTSCDLGAPFFRLNPGLWRSQIKEWSDNGVLAPYYEQENDSNSAYKPFCGVPKMSSFSRYLLGNNQIVNQTKVHHLEKSDMGWILRDENYNIIMECKTLIITAPAAQSSQLLASTATIQQWLLEAQAAAALCQPQWSLLVELDSLNDTEQMKAEQQEGLSYAITEAFEKNVMIDRVIYDSAKQGREHQNKWVVQATVEWSKQHINKEPSEVAKMLLAELTNAVSNNIRFNIVHIHRWLLGQHTPIESPLHYFLTDQDGEKKETYYRWDNDLQLGLAGDWLCQGDIEGALLSAKGLSVKIQQDKGTR